MRPGSQQTRTHGWASRDAPSSPGRKSEALATNSGRTTSWWVMARCRNLQCSHFKLQLCSALAEFNWSFMPLFSHPCLHTLTQVELEAIKNRVHVVRDFSDEAGDGPDAWLKEAYYLSPYKYEDSEPDKGPQQQRMPDPECVYQGPMTEVEALQLAAGSAQGRRDKIFRMHGF